MAAMTITPADIIASINLWISKSYPLVKSVVFDPMAGYETTIENLRTTNIQLDKYSVDAKCMPILSWNRSIIRRGDNGKTYPIRARGADGKMYKITVALVEMDYRFVFMATNMKEVEQFETDWMVQSGLNGVAYSKVNMGQSLGEFGFAINWGMSLDDITFNLETNYYKALAGQAVISGPVISATELGEDELDNLIQVVEFKLLDCAGADLPDKFTITDLGE